MLDHIHIKGAKTNNLQNIEVKIPKNELIVVTGVSGSGKSSLTMDTLFAEGQRRYVESLSSYARQFLMRMKKPEVDFIKGICPAIAVEQKVSTRNARSTVGTLTEIYDFLRILFARIGKTYSPISGQEVKRQSVSDVVDFIHSHKESTRVQLLIPFLTKYERSLEKELDLLLQKGYIRILHQGSPLRIEDILEEKNLPLQKKTSLFPNTYVLVDRFQVKHTDEDNKKRIADSILTAFAESEGECLIKIEDDKPLEFNNRFEADGMEFLEPSIHLFNYNNPFGACPTCEGFSKVLGIDERKVIPNQSLSLYEDMVQCWKGENASMYKQQFIKKAKKYDFPIRKPYNELTEAQKDLLWQGKGELLGINHYFQELESKKYKIQNRIIIARYRGRTTCPTCKGGRLREEAYWVLIDGKHIAQLTQMPLEELFDYLSNLPLSNHDAIIADRLLKEVITRLDCMLRLGLGYLTLDRLSSTLSGGETQRINLTRMLGSNLTSSLYILDEPSVGLHPRDTARLVEVLQSLRDLGNTVVVVEHEEDVITNADFLVDVGPEAGINGGKIVYAGAYNTIFKKAPTSLTTHYLTGSMSIPIPKKRRKFSDKIIIKKAKENNLKGFDVTFPLNILTVVTGVSGSGKTTLVKQILYPALLEALGESSSKSKGNFAALEGDVKRITNIEMINQSPIGRSSRSNPVTYVKAYDAIRKLFSSRQLSKIRNYKPKHFSFNVEGGRCETCKGEGEILVEMQFLADVRLECDECQGKRFKTDVLEVKYKEKNIADVLNMSIEESLDFFGEIPEIATKIKPLVDVGLGYVKLGQSSTTLSGGEAQRVKLAYFLGKERSKERIFFIFDEPTTGLHFHDVQKLLNALNALVEQGHTVLVVEHNLEVIKSADYVIDLGPEGGKAGGNLVFQGTPENLLLVENSLTGHYLKEKLPIKS